MRIAVLGASGLVGRTMLDLVARADWIQAEPVVLTSGRSAGRRLPFRDRELICREVTSEAFENIDVALFSAGGDPSRHWAPEAVARGSWVVDNSSAWRMDPEVPLVVPEINGDLIRGAMSSREGGIIANPNCSTIQVAMATAPLDRAFGITEAHVTTFQAVSGAGQAAVAELERQASGADPAGGAVTPEIFGRTIAGNVIPAIGPALGDGSFDEEAKVIREMRKILGRQQDLKVSCTAARVPVINGHCAAVRVVFREEVDPQAAADVLHAFPGVTVDSDPHGFATPLEVSGTPEVHVGRLRRDPSCARGLLMWVVADNLLKGAAWNAVQIAECLRESPVR